MNDLLRCKNGPPTVSSTRINTTKQKIVSESDVRFQTRLNSPASHSSEALYVPSAFKLCFPLHLERPLKLDTPSKRHLLLTSNSRANSWLDSACRWNLLRPR